MDRFSDHDDDFVKDVEDSLEYDVERQIDQTIAAYNQKRDKDIYEYRPESINRTTTLPKPRIDSAKPTITIKKEPTIRQVESANPDYEKRRGHNQTKKEMFYERFNDYVRQNHISPEDFWNPTKDKLNSDEFKECLDIIGFAYGREEFEDVVFDITDADFNVTLLSLCAKIKVWENYTADKTLEALKDNVLKMAQESRKKLTTSESTKKPLLVRPQSGNLYAPSGAIFPTSARPFSGISGISSKSKHTLATTQNDFNKMMATDHLRRTNLENKSKQFISDQKRKEAKRDQVLALTLSKAKGEFELDCLAKMGEANEIAQSLGETTTYRAYHAADGNLKCHVYDYDQMVSELGMKEFVRVYKGLKQRSTQHQKPTKDQPNIVDRKEMAKKDRQTELKSVLFETMKLTNTLKSQLEKFEKAGLVYDHHPSKY